MKKPVIITIAVMLCLTCLLCIPQKLEYDDGGSVQYKAVLYDVCFWHVLTEQEGAYQVGTTVKVLGLTLYDQRTIEME